jgi:hypothetical protein
MKLLNFQLNAFALTVLATVLLTACGSKESEAEVKNYTAIKCPLISNNSLERNTLTLTSSYFLFRDIALAPHDIQVHLNGFYATGTSQIDNQIFDSSTRERLGFKLNDTGFVKIASILKMPTRADEKQTLQFSDRCQTGIAIAENGELGRQPKGVLYLLASRKSFIVMREGTYNPEENISVKFNLLNPRSQQVEEVTIPLQQIMGGDYYSAPTSAADQLVNKIQNLFKGGDTDNSPQWSINKQVKAPLSPEQPYFTVTKESEEGVIEGEILSVEFALEK